jgi:hypothetical protein
VASTEEKEAGFLSVPDVVWFYTVFFSNASTTESNVELVVSIVVEVIPCA